jgi:putative hydrolase of the HAD superfamily
MIKNIVFDYGYVLAYPRTGNWFIPPSAKKILGMSNIIHIVLRFGRMKAAFQHGYQHLNDNHLLFTEEEEISQFQEFYSRFLKVMGISKRRDEMAYALAIDNVRNDHKIVIYDDVLNTIKLLKSDYHISVLSDTWPSLQRILNHAHITNLLDGLVMSCDYGICKDNIKLFYHAIGKLGIEPEESVFIDDSEKNLVNAEFAGFTPILMDRRGRVKVSRYPIAHNMIEVQQIIARLVQNKSYD